MYLDEISQVVRAHTAEKLVTDSGCDLDSFAEATFCDDRELDLTMKSVNECPPSSFGVYRRVDVRALACNRILSCDYLYLGLNINKLSVLLSFSLCKGKS